MTFWEEHYRSEGNRAAEAVHSAPRTARGRRAAAVVERLPEARAESPCSVCGVNGADLFATCLPCDIADGYLGGGP